MCKSKGLMNNTHLKESFQYPDRDQQPHAVVRSQGSEQGEHCCHDNADAEHPLPSKPRCQPASRDLGDDVAVEERGENPT